MNTNTASNPMLARVSPMNPSKKSGCSRTGWDLSEMDAGACQPGHDGSHRHLPADRLLYVRRKLTVMTDS